MTNKKHLPTDIYANDEYLIHVKKIRDHPRPILQMAKRMSEYKDNCKLEGDKLIINGTKYGIEDLGKLPPNLSAYLAAEKSDSETVVFHGEFSPYSNFHPSPFTINNEKFHSAEQWIQYQKCLLSGDSYTANQILKCDDSLKAKRLSYRIKGFDPDRWRDDGFELCYAGIKEKFTQNPLLMHMLKVTAPKTLVEASNDKLWGTGIPLRDYDALKTNKWHGKGWLSDMLHKIIDT